MAVAIWDHSPTGRELIERRRQDGWTPRPTETVDGEVVLGLGACLIPPRHAGRPDDRGPSENPRG